MNEKVRQYRMLGVGHSLEGLLVYNAACALKNDLVKEKLVEAFKHLHQGRPLTITGKESHLGRYACFMLEHTPKRVIDVVPQKKEGLRKRYKRFLMHVFKDYEEWAKTTRPDEKSDTVITIDALIKQEMADVEKKRNNLLNEVLKSPDFRVREFGERLREYFTFHIQEVKRQGIEVNLELKEGEIFPSSYFRNFFGDGFQFFETIICRKL